MGWDGVGYAVPALRFGGWRLPRRLASGAENESTRETELRRKMESSADCCSFAAETADLLVGVKAHPGHAGPNACSSCIYLPDCTVAVD
jgi:hypothetical protein